jgi:type I restriction enzyme M protein
MPKAIDVPVELRQFNKLFESISYRWDYSSVFDDYLTYTIEVFNTEKTGEQIAYLKKKYGEQYEVLIRMFYEHLEVNKKMLNSGNEWYDLLGLFYEVVSSKGKASAMGQFFTPPDVCNMMAQLNNAEDSKGQWKRISDPACGSGRNLLAWNAYGPGNYLYGDDLDPMCAKMCTINLVMHGAVGQVSCMNSLFPEKWYFGYNINPRLYSEGLISINPIQKEEAFSYLSWQLMKKNAEETKQKTHPEAPVVKVTSNQLSMFD